jgi:exosortase
LGSLLCLLYGSTFNLLTHLWMADPNYSHGFLVPLISGWLAWRWYKQTLPPLQGQIALGIMEILAGGLFHLAAIVIVWPPLDFVGLLWLLRGMAHAVGGRAWASGLSFPTFFLFFMFPLPVRWTAAAAVWLQEIVSLMSGGILDLFWVTYRSGHSLHLAGLERPLVIAEECSGLRQIVAFVALAALIGYLSRSMPGRRLLLIAAAIPIAIIANVVRVLLMAIGAEWFGVGWFSGWLHDAPALVTLPAGLGLLAGLAWWLGRRQSTAGDCSKATRRPLNIRRSPPAFPRRSLCAVAAALALCVLMQLLLQSHLSAAGAADEYPALLQPLAQLPLLFRADGRENRAWNGEDSADLTALRAQVQFADELISRTYVPDSGEPAVRLYMVHSRQGEDLEHHPEICIRDVGGAVEDQSFATILYLDAEQRRPVQRFRFRTGLGRDTVIYYWHYSLDAATREGQTFLQALHQRLGRRPPSVTVQVSTNAPPEALGEVEQSFLDAVDRAMTQHILPPTARMGCERLPIRVTY